MKDKNGIEIDCSNCAVNAQRDCNLWNAERGKVGSNGCREYFYPSYRAYEARIAELEKKMTETIKLLSERSRECGELEAYNEVLQWNFSPENKDVLERLKEAESEEK